MSAATPRRARGTVVVVWTAYRAGPWSIRSLRDAGWDVVALHPRREGHGRSTACLRPLPCPSPVHETDAFLEAVTRTCREVGARALLPLGEESVRVLAEGAPDLGDTVLAGPDAAQYAALCDKRQLGGNAVRAGVAHPPGVFVTADGPSGDWPPFPAFVKSRDGVGPDGGTAATRVATAPERDRAVGELLDAGLEVVVEELIRAPQWTVHCARDGHGGFAGVAAVVDRNFPRGAGSPTVSVVGSAGEVALDATRRLLELIDYRGPANAQFFLRDGTLMVHDVNLRVPASVAIAIRGGVDVPALGVAAAVGERIPPAPPPPTGLRYVSAGDEVRALVTRRRPGAPVVRARTVVGDLVRAAAGRGAVLDPPLSDPLWIPADLTAAAKGAARRLLGRG